MPDIGGKAIKLIDHAVLPENLAPKREDSTSLAEDDVKELCAFLKQALGSRVVEVTATTRLFDSACAVSGHENAGMRQMRKMFMARAGAGAGAGGAAAMDTPPVTMMINPHHATVVALSRCGCACAAQASCACLRCTRQNRLPAQFLLLPLTPPPPPQPSQIITC
jgi:HSP90 family molecular chaperone